MAKLYGKDLSAYDDIDLDELLKQLNEQELEELSLDLIDPDVSKMCALGVFAWLGMLLLQHELWRND